MCRSHYVPATRPLLTCSGPLCPVCAHFPSFILLVPSVLISPYHPTFFPSLVGFFRAFVCHTICLLLIHSRIRFCWCPGGDYSTHTHTHPVFVFVWQFCCVCVCALSFEHADNDCVPYGYRQLAIMLQHGAYIHSRTHSHAHTKNVVSLLRKDCVKLSRKLTRLSGNLSASCQFILCIVVSVRLPARNLPSLVVRSLGFCSFFGRMRVAAGSRELAMDFCSLSRFVFALVSRTR